MIIDGKVIPRLERDVLRPFREAGVTAVNVPVALWHDFAGTSRNLTEVSLFVRENSDMMAAGESSADIAACAGGGKLGVITSFSSSAAFDDDVEKLAQLGARGVRIAQPVFLAESAAGGSCVDDIDHGLTDLGHRFVYEFNRLGMAIDLSHVGDKTASEVIRASAAPVFYAQAAPRALNPARRNKTDEAMRAVAERGGVICVAALRQYLPGGENATVEELADALQHCLKIAGSEHVGIGSDLTPGQGAEFFDYVASRYGVGESVTRSSEDDATPGFADAGGYAILESVMRRRGLRDSTIERIFGTNLLRFFESSWV